MDRHSEKQNASGTEVCQWQKNKKNLFGKHTKLRWVKETSAN